MICGPSPGKGSLCQRVGWDIGGASEIEEVRRAVAAQAPRVATLGAWPQYIDVQASLAGRIPAGDQHDAPGFDAGIACCLDLIPRERQRLAAAFHAAYTPEAVAQARREARDMEADSETCWWLAACSVCREGEADRRAFAEQLAELQALITDPQARQAAARSEFRQMVSAYELRDGIPYGEADGCMQGAYLDGHQFAVSYAANFDRAVGASPFL